MAAAKDTPAIELRNVSVIRDGRAIIRDLSIAVAAGETVAFIGRSGAGKSTALKLINGLVSPDSGSVHIHGLQLRAADGVQIRRGIGYVAQSPSLFPHRTVLENVLTVPRLLGWNSDRSTAAASTMLERVGLPVQTFGSRFPRSLSGGEQQRVSIVRALIAEPAILLCDEPFSALDPIRRREQQDALLALKRTSPAAVVFVTHDLGEARRIADRIVLMFDGSVVSDSASNAFGASDHEEVRRYIASTK